MAGNTFGRIFRLTTFGESHGPALGGVVDGCPAGMPLDLDKIQKDLDLRRPGSGVTSTKRRETDKIHILSGVMDGKATGTPIGFYIANEDQKSRDYGNLAEIFRPSHADWTYYRKYCGIRDHRGGGRASGRETAARVAGGAIARQFLENVCGARIFAGTVALGGIAVPETEIDLHNAADRPFFAAGASVVKAWEEKIENTRLQGDTLGGIARVMVENLPAGLGEPVFDKLDARLAYALMGVGTVKGVEIGDGFGAAGAYGSQNNDRLLPSATQNHSGENIENCRFASNHAGGIVGGISTGQPIIAQVAIKPIASIGMEQDTIDKKGNPVKINIGGRHDLSAIPRIIPVLEAMTALVLADAWLFQMRMAAFA